MENDKDVVEFRIAKDYLDLEDWERIPRRLGLKENIIANIRARQDLRNFKDRVYETLLEWNKSCAENSNIEELIKFLKEDNLSGPAFDIENAIKTHRNDGAQKGKWNIVGPVTEPTCAESVATAANYLKKIKIGSDNITNVSFSHDGVWFSTVEKEGCMNYLQIWEWATLSLRFQRSLDVFEIYAVYFNDGVSGDMGVPMCISVCDSKGQLYVYKVEDEMPIVCKDHAATSTTFGSWFKRDKFLSGNSTEVDTLWMRRICYGTSARKIPVMSHEILTRDVIENATLFKSFQNNMLLCFKSGRNLEVIHLDEDGDNVIQKSKSKFDFDQGNVGFFKLSSDSRNLFVMKESKGMDIHQFLNIELETLSETSVDVHIQGPYKYCDFGVTGGKIIIGSYQKNKSFFVYNLESKKCEQELRHTSNVCSVACHPTDPKTVITSDRGGNVLVWNLDDTIMK